jgi:hypothetical protein
LAYSPSKIVSTFTTITMKNFFKTSFLALVLALTLAGAWLTLSSRPAQAKSVQWNQQVNGNLAYFWAWANFRSGWVLGLSNPNVTVQYLAEVINRDTNTSLADNATVPVGARLRFLFNQHNYTHISWFGTGYSFDSPYGSWVNNAEPPTPELGYDLPKFPGRMRNTCRSQDFLNITAPGPLTPKFAVYIPLSINPPEKELTGLGGNLNCSSLQASAAGTYQDCTVSAPGPITPTFRFNSTYGRFYHRYYEWADTYLQRPGCYGHNQAMRVPTNNNFQNYTVQNQDFTLTVPAQTISFAFTAIGSPPPLAAPGPPIINGPAVSYIDQAAADQFKIWVPAHHSNVKYDTRWVTANASCDAPAAPLQTLPASGSVPPGELNAQTLTKKWAAHELGEWDLCAKTVDIGNRESAWAQHRITIETPPVLPSPTPTPSPSPSPTPTAPAACSDQLDNDNDNLIDAADPGCHTDGNANNAASYDPADDSELDASSSPTPLASPTPTPPDIIEIE